MKRFITAMLTLALTTALSSETASAQDRMQSQTQLRDNGYYTGMVGKWHIGYEPAGQVYAAHGSKLLISVAGSSENGFQRYPPLSKSKNASPSFVTSRVDLASTPDDCPNIMNPPGFNSRVPVAGYDCQGQGTFNVSDRYVGDDPFWDVLPPDARDYFSHNPEW